MHFHARVHSIVRGSPFAVAIVIVAACSSSSSSGSGNAGSSLSQVPGILEPDASMCSSPGGPVAGPDDLHCWNPDGSAIIQPTTTQGCYADAAAPGSGGDDGGGMSGDAAMAGDGAVAEGGMPADSGMPDIGNCGDSDYGATLYNDYGADDDCKYNVTWSSSPICENQPVYFTVIVTHRTDGTALTGANPRPDVVLNCDHPVPNGPDGKPTARTQSPEVAPGTYVVGPVVFDKPGKWVFRFHFDEECLDISPESPHGHAAFWVNVP